ncbi:glycosyltransferase family 9 protein [Testudinibacter sp. TR-2022]|uniref:glycosyltransferase family 9 protein n=1 Tax=Testudinibacter sp. TR-2022 TaxID=2585029 RepID=UPI00111B19C3|nr:glycosyltransferase family 9 protein [Testudinibacter sp. TR-2022]TNH07020.1 glycosyltransferase family 9 protein [Pasteurellaceae bacterium Phil11]TNH21761.1 glycosyltransferase family 9 protein [Testudinibacter sp. TR-2022]TNH29074.1 glycosyltransferase family 9 protein [Testudinibacter sp. TR-2022]
MKKIKYQLRQWRIALGKWILDKTKPMPDNIELKSVLFLRQDGKIGDYIVSSFVFRELKKYNPAIKIGVVCSDDTFFSRNTYIDKIYRVKKKNILDYIRIALQIRKEKYDVLIDPTVFLRNRDLLLIRLINAKINLGYQKQHYQLFNLNMNTSGQHFAEVYANALHLLGIEQINQQYDIPCDIQSEKNISEFLRQYNTRPFIAINCFGAASSRKLNLSNIIALLEYLTALCPQKMIALLTYPQVTAQLQSIAAQYDNVIIYQNTKTIFDSIAIIRQVEWVISPDTSIVHIASGLNKKLIAFYQDKQKDPINFAHWHPNNQAETHILFYPDNINQIHLTDISADWFK